MRTVHDMVRKVGSRVRPYFETRRQFFYLESPQMEYIARRIFKYQTDLSPLDFRGYQIQSPHTGKTLSVSLFFAVLLQRTKTESVSPGQASHVRMPELQGRPE